MREEARLREADDADSHHIAVAKFMQKVLRFTNELVFSCVSCSIGGCYESVLSGFRSKIKAPRDHKEQC